MSQTRRQFSRRLVAELMAGFAAVRLRQSIHCSWSFMVGEMPFPLGPVPGKSLFGGSCSSEYQ